ncbi:hypothetical protein [Thalassobacillus sp. CUG 92003]|uniref:hypothetical protein n=1 Tax=Thalassobacillus sp. CUG 92003 TaxID=2736641 RepID=UPI0015E730DB|nr:hypothetical protein [Thalassobacillus sp. CUG 92003]
MKLKERLIVEGFDVVDILVIDEENNNTTISDVSLTKVNDLEYKLYLQPESVEYKLNEEYPHFIAKQEDDEGELKDVKGYILEW